MMKLEVFDAGRRAYADRKMSGGGYQHIIRPVVAEAALKLKIEPTMYAGSSDEELSPILVFMELLSESLADMQVQDKQSRRVADSRAELIGTLKNFIRYLDKMGVANREDWDDELDWHRVLHKYVYIAKQFGMRIAYDFDFLETGAFSADMEIDLYELNLGWGGTESFAGNSSASNAFMELVNGRGVEWLQIATFAIQEFGDEQTCDEFAKKKRGRTRYNKRIAKDACESVNVQMKKLLRCAP